MKLQTHIGISEENVYERIDKYFERRNELHAKDFSLFDKEEDWRFIGFLV